jgi:hypothetical protein
MIMREPMHCKKETKDGNSILLAIFSPFLWTPN